MLSFVHLMVNVEEIMNILEVDEIIPEPENPLEVKISENPRIEFKNVSFTYDEKLPQEE